MPSAVRATGRPRSLAITTRPRCSGEASAWHSATASASAACDVARLLGKAQDHAHHPLHLTLLGATVAAHRLLDASGRVLGAVEIGQRGRDEHGAARLTDEERDAGVCTHERLLERDGVRRMRRNELLHSVEDRPEAALRALARGRVPDAVRDGPDLPVAFVDDPVPARSSPRIDAEYLHGRRVRAVPDVTRSCDRRLSRIDGRPPIAGVPSYTLQRRIDEGKSVMPSFRGRRPSPAMIVACLALAASLGGTGIAAVTAVLPRKSVGTAQ